MRKVMTDAELKLWNELRAHRLMGLAFRRQFPIVEVDGSQHGDVGIAVADTLRTKRLEQDGWTVLRFWNDDAILDIGNVCQHIVIAAGLADAG